MPYILASMHPLQHFTWLIIEIGVSKDINILRGPSKPDDELINCIYIMIASHSVCLLIEALIKFFQNLSVYSSGQINPYKHSYIQKTLLLLKVFTYFIAIMYSQKVVINSYLDSASVDDYHFNDDVNHLSVVLLYEVLLFYFNIMAMMLFLIFSRIVSFRKM